MFILKGLFIYPWSGATWQLAGNRRRMGMHHDRSFECGIITKSTHNEFLVFQKVAYGERIINISCFYVIWDYVTLKQSWTTSEVFPSFAKQGQLVVCKFHIIGISWATYTVTWPTISQKEDELHIWATGYLPCNISVNLVQNWWAYENYHQEIDGILIVAS